MENPVLKARRPHRRQRERQKNNNAIRFTMNFAMFAGLHYDEAFLHYFKLLLEAVTPRKGLLKTKSSPYEDFVISSLLT